LNFKNATVSLAHELNIEIAIAIYTMCEVDDVDSLETSDCSAPLFESGFHFLRWLWTVSSISDDFVIPRDFRQDWYIFLLVENLIASLRLLLRSLVSSAISLLGLEFRNAMDYFQFFKKYNFQQMMVECECYVYSQLDYSVDQ